MKRYEDSASSFSFFLSLPVFCEGGRVKRNWTSIYLTKNCSNESFPTNRCNSNDFSIRDTWSRSFLLSILFLDNFIVSRNAILDSHPLSNIDRNRFLEGKQCRVTRTSRPHHPVTLFFSRSTECETKSQRVDTRNRGRDLPFIGSIPLPPRFPLADRNRVDLISNPKRT